MSNTIIGTMIRFQVLDKERTGIIRDVIIKGTDRVTHYLVEDIGTSEAWVVDPNDINSFVWPSI